MSKLNEAQIDAVFSDSDKVLCLAGAGTGKTRVLVERISRLVSGGVDPRSILCLTFTNAAAFEMKERFKLTNPNISCPEFRTFHSFCYDIIISNKSIRMMLGYTNVPTIADESIQKRIYTHASKQLGVMLTKEKMSGTSEMTELEKYNYKLLKKSADRLMKKENVITYDKLIESVSQLFIDDNEEIKGYKDRFQYVLVDEFQDTDKRQWSFVQSFQNSKLFVVGDALQNLYSWRGTDSSIIKSLASDPDWHTVKLERNYRSSKNICKYANDFTASYAAGPYRLTMHSDTPGPLVDERIVKNYRGRLPDSILQAMLVSGSKLSGTSAILCRTNAEVKQVQEYLKSMKVEFETNQKDTDAVHILRSAVSDNYLMDWLSTFLKSERYPDYIKHRAINKSYSAKDFLTDFGWASEIDGRAEKIYCIKRICNEDRDMSSKLKDVLSLLESSLNIDVSRCRTNEQLLQTITSAFENDYSNESSLYVGTVHSVKGLEFDNVIVLGANGPNFRLNTEESNNIFYVAVTRARQNLVVFKVE